MTKFERGMSDSLPTLNNGCDYCDEGNVAIDGWHLIPDPEDIEGSAKIMCPNHVHEFLGTYLRGGIVILAGERPTDRYVQMCDCGMIL